MKIFLISFALLLAAIAIQAFRVKAKKKREEKIMESIPTTSNNHLVSIGDSLFKYFREDAEKQIKESHKRYL